MITLQQFIDKYEGKAVGVPWGYVGECVSLVQRYLNECYGLPLHARGNGKDWQNTILKEKIGVTTTNPVRGDIVVWGANAGGGYGHVTIYLDDKLDFDQNQGGDRFSRVRKRHPLKPIAYMHLTGKRPMEQVSKRTAQDGYFKVDVSKVVPKVTKLNIRDSHSTSAKVVGSLGNGDEIRYDSFIVAGGYHWVSWIRNGVRVYAAWRVQDGIKYGVCRFATTVAPLKVGDKVKVKPKSKYEGASKGKPVSDYALKTVCNIVEIKGDIAKLNPINSWVRVADLIKL